MESKSPVASPPAVFLFDTHEVRTIVKDGEPWFVAKDVAEILGYKETGLAVRTHCKGGAKHTLLSNGGKQEHTIIPERDVYRLIMRSKLPSALRFEEWVVAEVLPALRKTGCYAMVHDDDILTKHHQQAIALYDSYFDSCKKMNMTGNLAIKHASDAVLKITGISVAALLGLKPRDESEYLVTDQIRAELGLAHITGPDHLLQQCGLQEIMEHVGILHTTQYWPTAKGMEYAWCTGEKGRGTHSSPLEIIKWHKSVLGILEEEMIRQNTRKRGAVKQIVKERKEESPHLTKRARMLIGAVRGVLEASTADRQEDITSHLWDKLSGIVSSSHQPGLTR